MFSDRFSVAGLAAALTALAAGSAAASTPLYMTGVQGMQVGPDVPSSYFDDSNGYQNHSVSSDVTKSNFKVSALASSANGGTAASTIQLAPIDGYAAPDHALTAISQASILYTFSIVPKNGSMSVDPLQVQIRAAGAVSWNNSTTPTALFRLSTYYPTYFIINDYITRNDNGDNTYIQGSDSFSTDEAVTLYTNSLYNVQIATSAFADARSFGNDTYGEVSASVDPTFTLLGVDASQYTFVGAPDEAVGSAPTGAVPEPASWALMLAGSGLAGASLRRRRALPVA